MKFVSFKFKGPFYLYGLMMLFASLVFIIEVKIKKIQKVERGKQKENQKTDQNVDIKESKENMKHDDSNDGDDDEIRVVQVEIIQHEDGTTPENVEESDSIEDIEIVELP